MQLHRPFLTVTSAVDGDVLTVLARADAEFTPPEIQRLSAHRSVEGIRASLDRLVEQGVVERRVVGRAGVYRLNRRHLAAGPIVSLAALGEELIVRLRVLFEGWSEPAEFAALFGSGAKGTMRAGSDLDLFVVRPQRIDSESTSWREQIADLEDQVSVWTGNDTRVLEMGSDDCRSGVRGGAKVLIDIARDGIVLAGPLEYFTRLGSRRRGGR
ncbi:MAG: nucleotidyltransferase domain-containing protein [Acidimicrobiia bacterium]|nr:nucleotidyltransferase domain-containing protein [Acidimicrobiia bacterium]